jgi:hypothetical protein
MCVSNFNYFDKLVYDIYRLSRDFILHQAPAVFPSHQLICSKLKRTMNRGKKINFIEN